MPPPYFSTKKLQFRIRVIDRSRVVWYPFFEKREAENRIMDDIVKKIQSMSLTRTGADIADYILAHLSTVGFQSVTALAAEIGVSDTSVIRFIRKLGYKGYSDFRNEMNVRAAQKINQTMDLSPGEKYAQTLEQITPSDLINNVSQYTFSNLQKTYAQLDQETVEQIVDIILASDRKYIAGFHGTACCAQYMASKLLFLTPHVVLLTHADATAAENILDITEHDCLFIFSFPRYSEINQVLMDIAGKNGAKIILVTDRRTCPLANKADVIIVACVEGLGFTNSYVAPLSLSEVILLAVSGRKGENQSKRFREIDEVMGKEKLY